jgi:hypothetical protein
MRKTMQLLSAATMAAFSALPVSAHLLAGSLKPAGGETFVVGENITIEWVATQAHDGRYDIYYSKDGGKTYAVELAGPWQGSKTDNAKNSYLWKAPAAAASAQVRIRICQLYGGHCAEPGTYMMDSPANFTITTSTGLEREKQADEPRLDFSADGKSLIAAFTLTGEHDVSLKAFDVSGKCVATVVEGRIGAGDHRIPVFQDNAEIKGPLMFTMTLDGKAGITQTWKGR